MAGEKLGLMLKFFIALHFNCQEKRKQLSSCETMQVEVEMELLHRKKSSSDDHKPEKGASTCLLVGGMM